MLLFTPFKSTYLFLLFVFNFQLISCGQNSKVVSKKTDQENQIIKTGAERTQLYLNLLKGKNVAVVGNQTSVIQKIQTRSGTREVSSFSHLVDSLLLLDVSIKKVFAPEHGFRGKADAGEIVKNGFDTKTGLSIVSLYGKNKKPSAAQLSGIDVVVFDIQDVGARFYTYLSTLLLVMEAAAESDVEVLVLDRPNPHGHHVEGPMLDPAFKSFVGWAPVPVIHGMTFGELAKMAVGEGWLEGDATPRLTVIKCGGYAHSDRVMLSIAPSPNLPTHISVELYPSLCFLEPTNVSIGRGTPTPFEIAGIPIGMIPNTPDGKDPLRFTPVSKPGASPNPKHENVVCVGNDFKSKGEEWWMAGPSWDLSILETYAHSFRNDENCVTNEEIFTLQKLSIPNICNSYLVG